MRILFVTSVSTSHLAPMVPLAWGLRAAGHEVRVACDADTAPGVLAFGLAATVVATEGDFARRHRESVHTGPGEPYYRDKDSLPRLFADNAVAMLDGLLAVADRWRPDALVHEPVAFAAEAVAAAQGVPALRHLWGPDVFGTPKGLWLRERVRELLRDRVPEVVSAAREFVIDPCPAPMQSPGPGRAVPIRFVPVDRPGTVPHWLLDPPERDRICVTWGTFADGVPGPHPLVRALHGISELGMDTVLVARSADLARLGGELPAGVRAVADVPLHAVLASCTAAVHHGGANSLLGAAVRGLPQLVVSDSFETGLNGARLAGTGAGLHLSSQEADADAVVDAARKLVTEDRFAQEAMALRSSALTRPAPAHVAGEFEELTARRSAPATPITEGA
jgi:UDP:flavonoid glycosyltransferase YjiC (YdhE family)